MTPSAPSYSELRNDLREWLRFLRSEAHVLDKHPTLFYTQAANQPDGTVATITAQRRQDGRAWLRWTGKPKTRSPVNMTVSAHRAVRGCLASADGTRIVSASADGTLKVWDAVTGAEVMVYAGHSAPVTTCAYSPDDSIILSGSEDGTLKFWQSSSSEPMPVILLHDSAIRACSWSRQGNRIASAGDDRILRVWDAASGRKLQEIAGHEGEILSCCFSPDGSLIVSGSSDNSVRLWDPATGDLRATLAAHRGAVRACVFSPDGKTLLTGAGFVAAKGMFAFAEVMELALWDVLSAVSERSITPLLMRYPSWAAPGASAAGILSLFDPRISSESAIAATAQTAKSLATTPDEELHEGGVLAATFSPDGKRVLTASADATLRLWDATTLDCRGSLSGHSQPVNACAWSRSGNLVVSGSEDGSLKVWDVSLATVASRSAPARKLEHVSYCLSPDGRTLATGAAVNQMLGLILLSDVESGEQRGQLTGHEYCAVVTDFSPDGKRLLSRAILRGPPLLWDVPTRKRAATLGPQGEVTHCTFSPDGLDVLVAEQSLSLWSSATHREVRKFEGAPVTINCGFTLDGETVFAIGGDECLRFWDRKSGKPLWSLRGVNGVCGLSPDGQRILCVEADGTAQLRDVKTGVAFVVFVNAARPCAFAPDGTRIVACDDARTLVVYDANNGSEIVRLSGHTDRITSCEFSPDGTCVLSRAMDQTARIWDADTGRELTRYYLPDGVTIARWNPGGCSLVVGDSAGRARELVLENIVIDPPLVTAWRESSRIRGFLGRFKSVHFGCPLCRRWTAVPSTVLGGKIACPRCEAMLQLSALVVAADPQPIAKAWEG